METCVPVRGRHACDLRVSVWGCALILPCGKLRGPLVMRSGNSLECPWRTPSFFGGIASCRSYRNFTATMSYETTTASKDRLSELVDRFRRNIHQYRNPEYNEENTRADFIDKFFALLDWDMNNDAGNAEQYREVVRERRQSVNGQQKFPDYTFRIGQEVKFYCEAKRPALIIKNDIKSAFQLRVYGYSRPLPLSILTSFNEFAIYNTGIKPHENDNPATARIFHCHYHEFFDKCRIADYETNFDYIAGIFAKKNILQGSFDRYAQSDAIKRGTSPVDKELLIAVEGWRVELAKSVARRNPTLDVRSINVAVQKIIDRILFLRIAEGRNIERYENLLKTTKGPGIYGRLQELFTDADRKYNAGLFERCDWLESLAVDDKILLPIISGLYGEKCPYAFEAIPIEILGSIYERFLGKTILLTAGHNAKVEEKPEVRKAGGVYYTPQKVVDYIVRETVGRRIDVTKPIPTITILDPACGSGSFLIGAYTFLLDAHLSHYTTDETARKKAIKRGVIYEAGENTYRLSIEEKQRILLSNIFGVDTDQLAVEVTKLSLYLKLMEDETAESRESLFRHSDLKMLPNLDKNIQCGNSLIESDFYDGKSPSLFDDEEMRRINTFDWQAAFPTVYQSHGRKPVNNGFDIVIGNPPYVRQETLDEETKRYFQKRYTVYHGTADLYAYFVERGIKLLKDGGDYAIIVANKWLRANYGEPLRRWLKTQNLVEIIDFGDLPVFGKVTAYPMILRVNKSEPQPSDCVTVAQVENLDFKSLADHLEGKRHKIAVSSLDDAGWQLRDEREKKLFDKLMATGIPLKDYVQGKIYRGVLTGLNEAFVIDCETRERLIQEDNRSAEIIKPFLAGRDIKRYAPLETDKFLILIPKGFTNENGKHPRSGWKWLCENYPAIAKHLEPFKKRAQERCDQGDYWWELRACDYYDDFEQPKIIYPNILKQPEFTFDEGRLYSNQKSYIIPLADKFLLAILNSSITSFFFRMKLPKLRGGFYEPNLVVFKFMPICRINERNKKEVEKRDRIIDLVDQMLTAQANLRESASELDRKRIAILDGQIDKAVYELYGLTGDEIQIVTK